MLVISPPRPLVFTFHPLLHAGYPGAPRPDPVSPRGFEPCLAAAQRRIWASRTRPVQPSTNAKRKTTRQRRPLTSETLEIAAITAPLAIPQPSRIHLRGRSLFGALASGGISNTPMNTNNATHAIGPETRPTTKPPAPTSPARTPSDSRPPKGRSSPLDMSRITVVAGATGSNQGHWGVARNLSLGSSRAPTQHQKKDIFSPLACNMPCAPTLTS
jgi:hypothetical protein